MTPNQSLWTIDGESSHEARAFFSDARSHKECGGLLRSFVSWFRMSFALERRISQLMVTSGTIKREHDVTAIPLFELTCEFFLEKDARAATFRKVTRHR